MRLTVLPFAQRKGFFFAEQQTTTNGPGSESVVAGEIGPILSSSRGNSQPLSAQPELAPLNCPCTS